LSPVSESKKEVVDHNNASWNRLASWLHGLEALRAAA
jgi:hypothetical protein